MYNQNQPNFNMYNQNEPNEPWTTSAFHQHNAMQALKKYQQLANKIDQNLNKVYDIGPKLRSSTLNKMTSMIPCISFHNPCSRQMQFQEKNSNNHNNSNTRKIISCGQTNFTNTGIKSGPTRQKSAPQKAKQNIIVPAAQSSSYTKCLSSEKQNTQREAEENLKSFIQEPQVPVFSELPFKKKHAHPVADVRWNVQTSNLQKNNDVAQLTEANKESTNVKNQQNVLETSGSELTNDDLSVQMATHQLENIVTDLMSTVSRKNKSIAKVPSAMLQTKVKRFFKTPNEKKNQNNGGVTKKQSSSTNRIQNCIATKKSSFCSSTKSNSIQSKSCFSNFLKRNNSTSSKISCRPRGDIFKKLQEEVQKAIADHKTFTICGRRMLGPMRKALVARGWVEKFHSSYRDQLPDNLKPFMNSPLAELLPMMRRDELNTTCQNLIKSKLLEHHQVDFYWGYGREPFKTNPDYKKLTLINRLKKEIFNYCNKAGLGQANDTSYWFQKDNVSKLNHPRTYSLAENDNVRAFIEDFRMTAAMGLLKWVIKMHNTKECKIVGPTGKVPLETFDFALNECCKLVKKGRHEDIDMCITAATDEEWNQFLMYFYQVVHYSNHFKCEGNQTEESLVGKCNYVLKNLNLLHQNLDMDGMMNMWILKPVSCSMGRGIYMCRTLEYALNVIKEHSQTRYIAQKYIERPLLIYNTKFDIRQWFLISSCCPLTIWMYKECYLRFSSQTYNLRKLHKSVHLTNNSIQSKYKTMSMDSGLPNYNMWDSVEFKDYLSNIGYPDAYKDIIYSGMKQSIIATILILQDKMAVRKNCFELYGADFMITEDFQPWLLEINPSPALYGSTPITARMCPKVLNDLIKVVIDYKSNDKAPTGSFEMIYKQRVTKIPPNVSLEVTGLSLRASYFRTPSEEDVHDSIDAYLEKTQPAKILMNPSLQITGLSPNKSHVPVDKVKKSRGAAVSGVLDNVQNTVKSCGEDMSEELAEEESTSKKSLYNDINKNRNNSGNHIENENKCPIGQIQSEKECSSTNYRNKNSLPSKDSSIISNSVVKQSSLKSFSGGSLCKAGDLRRSSSLTNNELTSKDSIKKPFSPLLRQLQDEVQRAMMERKIFTIRRGFVTMRKILVSRGWVEKFHSSYKKQLPQSLRRFMNCTIGEMLPLLRSDDLNDMLCQNLIKSKLLGKYQADFYWGFAENAFRQHPDGIKFTLINKLKTDVASYNNKEALCEANKTAHWLQRSNISKLNHPRTYALKKDGDVRGFIEDFHITAAMSLLKWIVDINSTKKRKLFSPTGKVPLETFEFALSECWKVVDRRTGQEDIDMALTETTDYEWAQFLDDFYQLVHHNYHFKRKGKVTEDCLVAISNHVLKNLGRFCPFLDMDGFMNMWILKPVVSNRGRGIRMCSTLQDVVKIIREHSNTSYVIQKYIERSLLIFNMKFGIRQWFLISSCCPLTLWMYRDCYVRFSSQTYNLTKLHESVHLTNNSAQCKYKKKALDSVLPSYNMWDFAEFQQYLSGIGHPNTFEDIIYPGMKQSITAAVLIQQKNVVPRKGCFEAFGADFMLTEDFQPWLIEINRNPALNGSTPVTARMCPQVLEDLVKVVIDYARDDKAKTGDFEMIYKEQPTEIPSSASFNLEDLPLQESFHRLSTRN